jgi:toxin ParE1/3/4
MARRRVVTRHEIARQSLEKIADYLADAASLKVAIRFLERAEEAFAFILNSPGAGHQQEFRSPRLGPVRAWPIRGFRKWRVYYREVVDGVEVLDVMHGAQNQEARLEEKSLGDEAWEC